MLTDKDPFQIKKTLVLILQFLENNTKREEFSQPNCSVAYKRLTDSEFVKMNANFHTTTLGTIRRKVAENYQKPLSSLILISNQSNEKYDYLTDDVLLSNLRPPFVFFADFSSAKQENMSPSLFFSKCQYFQESLLDMLSQLNQNNEELA